MSIKLKDTIFDLVKSSENSDTLDGKHLSGLYYSQQGTVTSASLSTYTNRNSGTWGVAYDGYSGLLAVLSRIDSSGSSSVGSTSSLELLADHYELSNGLKVRTSVDGKRFSSWKTLVFKSDLPTMNTRNIPINGTNYVVYSSIATNTANIYAPTTAGTAGQVVKSNGSGAPTWINQSSLSVGSAVTATKLTTLSASAWGRPYWVDGIPQTIKGDMTDVGNMTFSKGSDAERSLYISKTGSISLRSSSTGGCAMAITSATNDGKSTLGTLAGTYTLNNALGYLYYGGTYDSPAMVINSKKNIGVGNTSPGYKFHVTGEVAGTGFYKTGSSDSYLLLGGGGHKAVSSFAAASHTHDYAASSHTHDDRYYTEAEIDTKLNRSKSKQISISSSTEGWYRCATISSSNAGSAQNVIISLQRSYNSPQNEHYILAISIGYNGDVSINQLSGCIGSQRIPKIRIVYNNSGNCYFDFYGKATNYANTYRIQIMAGDYKSVQEPELVSTAGGTIVEFSLAQGIKSGYGFTGNLTGDVTGNLTGNVTGNATSATKLQTARTINGTSFNGTGNITTANWGTSRTITIGNTGKSVNGSANISWSLSEIGAAAASHTHNYLPLTGGTLTLGSIDSFIIKKTGNLLPMVSFNGPTSSSNTTNIKYGYLGFNGADNPVFGKLNSARTSVESYHPLLHAGNYDSYCAKVSHTHSYLPLSGGTMTGTITSNAYTILQSYYNNKNYATIVNHNNGNISLSAASGSLYLGYTNTAAIYCRGSYVNIDSGNYTNYFKDYWNSSTSRTANTVLAAPNGSAGAATFRKLVAADLPTHTHSYLPLTNSSTPTVTNSQSGIVNFKSTSTEEAGIRLYHGGTDVGGLWGKNSSSNNDIYIYNASTSDKLGIDSTGPYYYDGSNRYDLMRASISTTNVNYPLIGYNHAANYRILQYKNNGLTMNPYYGTINACGINVNHPSNMSGYTVKFSSSYGSVLHVGTSYSSGCNAAIFTTTHSNTSYASATVDLSCNSANSFGLNTNGKIRCSSLSQTSDKRVKNNITFLSELDEHVRHMDDINFVSFKLNDDSSNRTYYGFVAQDVQKYYPEAVEEGQILGLNYNSCLVLKIANLERKIRLLETRLSQLEKEEN